MSNNVIVEREKGLAELERRIAELRQASAAQPLDMSSEIAALEQKYQQILHEFFGKLSPWEKVNMARHPEPPDVARLHLALRPVRRAPRRPPLPRRPVDRGRLRFLAIASGRGDRPAAGARHEGKPAAKLRHAGTGRVSQGNAAGEARGALPAAAGDVRRYQRAPIPGISSEEHAQSEAIATCLQDLRDGRRADRRNRRRRGRLRRCAGARNCGLGVDARKQHLLGGLAGGLRGNPVVRRRKGGGSGGAVEVDRR